MPIADMILFADKVNYHEMLSDALTGSAILYLLFAKEYTEASI